MNWKSTTLFHPSENWDHRANCCPETREINGQLQRSIVDQDRESAASSRMGRHTSACNRGTAEVLVWTSWRVKNNGAQCQGAPTRINVNSKSRTRFSLRKIFCSPSGWRRNIIILKYMELSVLFPRSILKRNYFVGSQSTRVLQKPKGPREGKCSPQAYRLRPNHKTIECPHPHVYTVPFDDRTPMERMESLQPHVKKKSPGKSKDNGERKNKGTRGDLSPWHHS